MRRIVLFLSFLLFLYASWTIFEKQEAFHSLKADINRLQENPGVTDFISTVTDGFQLLLGQLKNTFQELPQQEANQKKLVSPELEIPQEQLFSIFNIEIGDLKSDVEKQLGIAKRASYNEYGIQWHTYHENYQHFVMVGYNKDQRVVGLYTNQDLITSSTGIKLGSPKQLVLDKLGEPLTQLKKGFVYYQFHENRDYDMFLQNNSYITVFYDKHEDNTVTSIQIISQTLEQQKKDIFPEVTPELKEGLEYQLFDVTNATRVNHGLGILTWDEHVRGTARKHSADMAENSYFDHTNQQGKSPFDRMQEDDIVFTLAGENLAYGQFSSIFAHEGLMNSLGHRENILQPDFEFLGVGVAFNSKSEPYYTENFYAD